MQQSLEETKILKTEIMDIDEELLLYNIEMENAMVIKNIKNEKILVCNRDSGMIENVLIKTEVKSEDTEEMPNYNFVKDENLNSLEMPENSATIIKYEIKSEEVDITYPSLSCKNNVDLKELCFPETATANYCDGRFNDGMKMKLQSSPNSKRSQKQCQKIKVNQLRAEGTNFKGNVARLGKNTPFYCFHCDFSTTFKRNLISHMIVHDKRKKELFSCTNCDYSTYYKRCLVRHAIRVHSENCKKHSCRSCEKRFKNKISLDDHIIKNHQNCIDFVSSKVHSCSACSYKTTVKISLTNHIINAHSGNSERHLCRGCEKHFKTKQSLDDHIIKNHHDFIGLVSSKIHTCMVCNYKTTIKTDLQRHTIVVHSRNYAEHSCSGCEKHFKKKTSLDDHILKNHDNFIDLVSSRVHNCPTCSYRTAIKTDLTRHTIKVHSRN